MTDTARALRGVHVITDATVYGRDHLDLVRVAAAGGAAAVQLRDKDLSDADFYSLAVEARAITRERGVTLIINDRVHIALAVGADGVHVGEHDLPPEVARRLLGSDMILGVSCYGLSDVARSALSAGAGYLGVGAVFATGTKETRPPIGLAGVRAMRAITDIPIVAIGGITSDTAADVIRAGADAVAVVGAVARARDPERAVRELVEAVAGARAR